MNLLTQANGISNGADQSTQPADSRFTQPAPFAIKGCRDFLRPFRLRRGRGQIPVGNSEPLDLIRTARRNPPAADLPDDDETVASFGAADLIRHRDGSWELQGGSPIDRAAAREWCSLFRHEATWPDVPAPVPVPKRGGPAEPRNRVLIADDDTLVRGSLATVLELEGFVVDEAIDGMEAITRATAQAPNLVLLDLNMPRLDGWTAFTRLDRARPLVPVIVITARPNQYKEAVRLGVDAFMEKPLNIPALVRAIKRLTREDENRHARRITNRAFVTQLLEATES